MITLSGQNISQSFQHTSLFSRLNFTLNVGERMVIMGPSGCGKSVFLRGLLGLHTFTQGEIFWNNQPLQGKTLRQFRETLGVVFQNSVLFDHLTIRDNILLPLTYGKKHSPLTVEMALEHVQLSPSIQPLYPKEISGGMQRRVALARAFITQPLYWICDEPTTGLDPQLVQSMSETMTHLCQGKTLITVTHDTTYAACIGTVFYRMTPQGLEPIPCPT